MGIGANDVSNWVARLAGQPSIVYTRETKAGNIRDDEVRGLVPGDKVRPWKRRLAGAGPANLLQETSFTALYSRR
jgi:hypothetical protein